MIAQKGLGGGLLSAPKTERTGKHEGKVKGKAQQLAAAITVVAYYDQAVNQAMMLSMEDPTIDKAAEVAKHQKQTEQLLAKFPVQPFKRDFIEGMKIRGRQKPITEFVSDFRGRINLIGDGIGASLFDERNEEGEEDESKRKNTQPLNQSLILSEKAKQLRNTNMFKQRDKEIEMLREAAMIREQSITEGPKLKDIMKQA